MDLGCSLSVERQRESLRSSVWLVSIQHPSRCNVGTYLPSVAVCKEYYQFILAHLLFGIAGGIVYNPCTSCVAHWFLRKRATAVGLILCGSGLGGVLLPIMLSRLLPRLGFRDSVLILAGVATVLFLPSWFTVKTRLPPKKGVPWSHAVIPWKETRYTVFVLGVALVWLK